MLPIQICMVSLDQRGNRPGGVYSGLSSLASLAEGAYSLKNCRKSSLVMHRLYGVFRPVSVSSCGAPERHLTKAAQTHHAFASKK